MSKLTLSMIMLMKQKHKKVYTAVHQEDFNPSSLVLFFFWIFEPRETKTQMESESQI